MPGNPEKNDFSCEICNFICAKKSNLTAHLSTRKHLHAAANHAKWKLLETLETGQNDVTENAVNLKFSCDKCQKEYKSKSGLWKHRMVCCKKSQPVELVELKNADQNNKNNDLILEVLKQNNELKNHLVEQVEHYKNIIITQNENISKQNEAVLEIVNNFKPQMITNNITNNFNLNVFLNETCKDAMNMNDFIENIQVQMKELENVGKNGYVTGITDIILDRLNKLDVSKRPVHCTDLKREVLYIKNENEWNKEDDDKSKIKNMISKVAIKNYSKIPEWRNENPECKEIEHNKYEFCIQMMRNSLGELGDEQKKLDDKIVKNIAKKVLINK
jgi:hypothetical protein